jgi:hypothetical protein
MSVLDTITDYAQDQYFTVNGAENDDTGADLTVFQNNYIRAFNLWADEYQTEAYWNVARVNDYVLATIADTTTYSFALPATYRSPIFEQNKYVKFVLDDGTIIAKFKLVNPNQRQNDEDIERPDRATFIPTGSVSTGGGNIILSRAPTAEEQGAQIVLDVVKMFPQLTTADDTVLSWIYSKQIATLGISKNTTLADVTKVSLSPSFTQRYTNELNKALNANMSSNDINDMDSDDYSTIGGIWG